MVLSGRGDVPYGRAAEVERQLTCVLGLAAPSHGAVKLAITEQVRSRLVEGGVLRDLSTECVSRRFIAHFQEQPPVRFGRSTDWQAIG